MFVFISSLTFCQDDFGIANSNYAPTKTVLHNPTNVIGSKTYLDIHLIGAGTFIYNNFLYLQGNEFSFLNNIILGQAWPEYKYDYSDRKKDGFQDTDIQLLSGSFQYKEHGFGLTSRLRTYFDFRGVPNEVAKLIKDGTGAYDGFYNQIIGADNVYMNQLSFLEIGGTYSNAFYHFDHDLMVVGGSIKYLIGITGAGVKIDELEYNVVDPNNTRFFKYKGSLGYAAGFNSGNGFSTDLGFSYYKMLQNVTYYNPFSKNAACEGYDYKFKIGASIIDLGYIKFKKDAVHYDIETDVTDSQLNGDEFSFNNFGSFAASEFTNVTENTSFTMLVPTALNLQADYNFENYFYASGQYIHGFFRRLGMGVQRPHVLNVSARYERRWFEASLSGSIYNFEDFRTGLALRFAYLTIGTDNLGSMLGFTNFYGTDLYFNLRYFMTRKPGCKRKHKKSRRNETRCVKN